MTEEVRRNPDPWANEVEPVLSKHEHVWEDATVMGAAQQTLICSTCGQKRTGAWLKVPEDERPSTKTQPMQAVELPAGDFEVDLDSPAEPEGLAPSIVWRGAADLEGLLVPIGELRPDPKNARRHPKRNVEAIAASLRAFGQRRALVAAGGVVYAGCGTLEAARGLGWNALAVSDASDLSPAQRRAYGLADNRTAELAEWDQELLAEQFDELPEPMLDLTGFDAEERKVQEERAEQKAEGLHPATITFSAEQWEVVKRAVDRVRAIEQDTTIEAARALELLCADFLA